MTMTTERTPYDADHVQIVNAEERLSSYENGRVPARRTEEDTEVALPNIVAPSLENMPTSIDPTLLSDADLGLGILAAAGTDPNTRQRDNPPRAGAEEHTE